jgi:glucan 1,3-beta-glucosidase
MHRRTFLKNTLGGALTLAALEVPRLALGQDSSATPATASSNANADSTFSKIRGVNLGAWLVLEKWMVPDMYDGTDAEDEYNLCLALGDQARSRMDRHRETFITADDFRWIRERGLNAVRLPVGYWALEGPKPYVEYGRFIDFALDQAQQNGLKLLLDLHGAPGSQNGWDHSGRAGPVNWPNDPNNINETLRILESFAQKFGKHPALLGIELLNEPRDVVPLEILQKFYRDAYARLRQHMDPNAAIVFHDSFRPLAWKKFMQEPDFSNVILDTHIYQCFNDADKARTAREHLTVALDRNKALDQMQREELPTIVGEWSLALPQNAMHGLSRMQVESAIRCYANAQLLNFEGTRGWFFWSYKLHSASEWNFRHCVEHGWLPASFKV